MVNYGKYFYTNFIFNDDNYSRKVTVNVNCLGYIIVNAKRLLIKQSQISYRTMCARPTKYRLTSSDTPENLQT